MCVLCVPSLVRLQTILWLVAITCLLVYWKVSPELTRLLTSVNKMAFLVKATRRLSLLKGHIKSGQIQTLSCRHMSGLSAAAAQLLQTRKSTDVLDSFMSYLDTSVGDNVVLFLHGNPTAAYLWRNVIPHVSPVARCFAPDLIGMGHSGKPDIQYKYAEHYKYLSAWIDKMDFQGKITIVCHDWGSGLGLNWCNQNRDHVRAIIHMESITGPVPNWDAFPGMGKDIFQALRSPAGEDMVLKNNFFVERIFPSSIIRKLEDYEMEEYLMPYKDSEKSRLPTLTWPREIPIASDGPEDVVKIAGDYNKWLSQSADIPKLYINGDPGFFSTAITIGTKNWPNHKTVTVKGSHFLQEDSPDEIGSAIRHFLEDVYKQ